MNPNYQSSIQFNQDDFDTKEKLRENGITIIDTWRTGAKLIIKEIMKNNERGVKNGK